jgi:hypothetical protein
MKSGAAIEFNPNSGYVFLVDDQLNIAMLNDERKLENQVPCDTCGHEYFLSQLQEKNDERLCEDCAPPPRALTDFLEKHDMPQ